MNEKIRNIMVRQSETREKLNTLAAVSDPSDTQTADLDRLRTEATGIEIELRTALKDRDDDDSDVVIDGSDPEVRERREIRSRSTLGRYLRAVVLGKDVDGAEAEFAAAHGCPDLCPLEMLEPTHTEMRERETRAVSAAPTSVGQTMAGIVPAVFQRSAAAWLGIEMPTVGVGDAGFPVLSTKLTADVEAHSAAADEQAGAFTVTVAQPRRVTGSFKFRREDSARLDGMEEALRMNLNSVMSDEVDNQAVNGSATGDGTLNGLLNRLDNPTAPAASAETWPRFNTALLSHVDGVFAVDRMGVRTLVGSDTFQLMGSVFRSNQLDLDILTHAANSFGGVRLSNRIPAKVSNIQQAIVRRTNPVGDRVAVMPTWQGVEFIRDHYTGAAKGEVVITALILVGDVVVLRSGAFVQDSFRVS